MPTQVSEYMTNRIARSVQPTHSSHSSASAAMNAANGTTTATKFAARCAPLSCDRPSRRSDWLISGTSRRIKLGRGRLLVEADEPPRRVDGVQEVRRVHDAEAVVVVVVLEVAGPARRADRAAQALRDRTVHRQRPELGAAVVVVDDE